MFFILIIIVADQALSVIFTGSVSYIHRYGYPSNKSILLALIQLLLFLSILTFVFNTVVRSTKYVNYSFGSISCNDRNILVLLIYFALGLAPYLSYGLSSLADIVLNSRAFWGGTSQFGLYGTGTTFLIFLHNFMISSALISGYFLLSKRIGRIKFFVCLVIFVLSLIIVASSGTRTKIGLVLFPLIMSSIYVNRQKISLGSLFKYGVIMVGILLMFSIMVQYRSIGYRDVVDGSKNNDIAAVNKFDMTGADLGSELFVIVKYFNKPLACRGFLECSLAPVLDTVNKFITNPIPRRLWPQKYLDPSFAHYNRFRTGYSGLTKKSGTNITPTVMGRYYMLYGSIGIIFPAVLFGLSLGVLQNQLNYIKDIKKIDLLLVFSFLFFFCSINKRFRAWLFIRLHFYAHIFCYM